MSVVIASLLDCTARINRAKAICDAASGGTQTALLEGDGVLGAAVGDGAAAYADIQSIKASLESLAPLLAKYDQGQ